MKLIKLGVLAIQRNRLFIKFKGTFTENYVLQSLVRQFGEEQFYWTSGNKADIEFILQVNDLIIPIEEKVSVNIQAKSLSLYRKKYTPKLSIRFSFKNLRKNDDLLNIPFMV